MLKLENHITFDKKVIRTANLATALSERDQTAVADYVWSGYTQDKASRSAWERRTNAAMELALQVSKDKTIPWPGSANVIFPLVTIAALQFSADAYPMIIQGSNVVRYKVVGNSGKAELERAKRIGRHMSWQVLEEDQSWEEQHDRLLINLAIVGCSFIKTYWHGIKQHPVDELVLASDLVLDYSAKSVEECARKTQLIRLYRNDIWERCAAGMFTDVRDAKWFQSYAQPDSAAQPQKDSRQGVSMPLGDMGQPFQCFEQHCSLDLDGDGYAEPYIATLEQGSKALLRLVARVDDEKQIRRDDKGKLLKIIPTEYYTKYGFIPSSDNGIYDEGFGKLLGPINEAVNSGINQLLDNGTLQNCMGGFLGRGAKIRGGNYTMLPWEWKRVDSTGDDLRKSLVPYPKSEPSPVTLQLLGLLIDYANRVAGTTDPMVGENPGQNTPASTFQGMQEQGKRVYRAIFKRVWRSMRQEFKKRYDINSHSLPPEIKFGEGDDFIRREDYSGSPDQVSPVANPNVVSGMMRIQQALAVKQAAMGTPGYDIAETERRFLAALEVESPELIYPGPDKVPPLPNPKMMVEQAKQQSHQMKIEYEKWKTVLTLRSQQAETQARIELLYAQAAAAIASIGADKARLQLESIQSTIDMLQRQHEMVNDRIEALSKVGGQDGGDQANGQGNQDPGAGGGSPSPGAVQRLAQSPSDGGVPPVPGAMGGDSQGAMGR